MEESIVFTPETDESALDDEVDKTNEAFQDAGEIELEVDKSALEDLGPDGALQVEAADGGGQGGGGGGGGIGGGAAAAAVSRIPKSISGSLAASAMPVALAGGIGVGMLKAMSGASAQLQTSQKLLGQAWNNVWRPLGDNLDRLFIREDVQRIVTATQNFEETLRSGDPFEATVELAGGLLTAGGEGGLGEQFVNNLTAQTEPGIISQTITDKVNASIEDNLGIDLPIIDAPEVTQSMIDTITGAWPGWPNLGTPTWPSASMLLGQFGAPSATALVGATFGTANIGGGDILDEVFGGISIRADDLIDEVTGGGGGGGLGGGTPGGGGGFLPFDVPFMESGGRVEQTGAAVVHRGEMVADPDRLVSDLADAIGAASGGDGGADMSAVESKLDTLHRDISRLASAMEQTELRVEGERLGELSKRGQAKSRNNNLLTQ